MKWLLLSGMLLSAALLHGQGSLPAKKVLFKQSVSLATYSGKGYHYYKPSEAPFGFDAPQAAYCTTGRQPMFCAFESKLSRTFKFPVKVRLDDHRYDFR